MRPGALRVGGKGGVECARFTALGGLAILELEARERSVRRVAWVAQWRVELLCNGKGRVCGTFWFTVGSGGR